MSDGPNSQFNDKNKIKPSLPKLLIRIINQIMNIVDLLLLKVHDSLF